MGQETQLITTSNGLINKSHLSVLDKAGIFGFSLYLRTRFMTTSSAVADRPASVLTATDYGLYGLTVFAWGFSWIAMKGQVGPVPPEISVFWRFVLAAALMFAWCFYKGLPLRFAARDHLRFAALGALIFSTNFTLFYYGAASLPSGLLSVVFSIASVFNLVLALIIFGQKPGMQTLIAGLLGFTGVALMFRPQILGTEVDMAAAIGLGLCILGTLSFCLGNMVSASNQARGLPLTQATSWGMAYGVVFLGVFAVVRGHSFAIDPTPLFLSSLVYLAVISTVVAFAAYLTLLGRIGSARAGYATVMFPVVALTVSTFFEGYQWTADAMLGLACVLVGNLLMLRGKRS